MQGIFLGDLIGSSYEGSNLKGAGLPFFPKEAKLTDDSVMALATYDALTNTEKSPEDFADVYRHWVRDYYNFGFSPDMLEWAKDASKNPFMEGNGAGIRAAVIGLLIDDRREAESILEAAVSVSHSPECLEIAKMLLNVVLAAKNNVKPDSILSIACKESPVIMLFDEKKFADYDQFDSSLWWTIAPAVHVGLKSESYEDLYSRVLALGGDTDSIGAMAGAIGQARWGAKAIKKNMIEQLLIQKRVLKRPRHRDLFEKLVGIA